jgi:hypothetical protein
VSALSAYAEGNRTHRHRSLLSISLDITVDHGLLEIGDVGPPGGGFEEMATSPLGGNQ